MVTQTYKMATLLVRLKIIRPTSVQHSVLESAAALCYVLCLLRTVADEMANGVPIKSPFAFLQLAINQLFINLNTW